MYNIEVKQAYLRTLQPTSINFELKMLKKLSIIEDKLKKDIYEIGVDELFSEISITFTSNEYKRLVLISALNYKSWCANNININQNISIVSNELEKISIEVEQIKKSMVSSPYFFNKVLNYIFYPVEDNTSDNIYRCASWLIYMGIQHDEIYNIKKSNLDFTNRTLRFKGSIYKIYDESIDVFKSCAKSTSFNIYSGSRKNQLVLVPRKDGNELLRNTNLNDNDENYKFHKVFKDVLSQRIKKSKINKDMSIRDIRVSGIFYRIAKNEFEMGIKPDFSCFSHAEIKYRYMYTLWKYAGAF